MGWIREARDRKSVRRTAEVSCQAVAEKGFRFLGDRTLDLSPRGVLVASRSEVSIGETVLLSFRVPRGRTWIDAEARVARVVKGTRKTDGERAIGLEFTRLDAMDRAVLEGALEKLVPTVPARALRRDYVGEIVEIATTPYDYATDVRTIAVF
jgi:hypothetical protein